MIEPVFKDLARAKSRDGVAFAEVDIGAGMGSAVAREFGVAATPTFLFFLDGEQVRMRRSIPRDDAMVLTPLA